MESFFNNDLKDFFDYTIEINYSNNKFELTTSETSSYQTTTPFYQTTTPAASQITTPSYQAITPAPTFPYVIDFDDTEYTYDDLPISYFIIVII